MEVAVGSELGILGGAPTDAHIVESIAPGVTLFAIADGFGEIGRGNPTAPFALATVRSYLRRRHRVGSFARNLSPSSLRAILLAALDHANSRLYAQSGSDEDFVGSGTSLTAVMIVGSHAFVGHVGDARAYLVRLGRLEMLTADDAMFADAAVTSAKSALPPKPRSRGLLWRSLGTQSKLEASIAHVELLPSDRLVLCTDGLHRCVEDDDVLRVLESYDNSGDAVARLLAAVRARGNVDVATVIVGGELLVPPQAPLGARAATFRPLRAALALVTIVATLLLGVFAVRSGYADRPTHLTDSQR